ATGLARPGPARGVDEQLELAPLVVPRDLVSRGDRGEAALRAEGQAIDGDVFRRLVDPPEEIVLRLELRGLRGDQAEDDGLVLRDEAKRLEAAGALAVVLQEKPIVPKPPEGLLRDPAVAAL